MFLNTCFGKVEDTQPATFSKYFNLITGVSSNLFTSEEGIQGLQSTPQRKE